MDDVIRKFIDSTMNADDMKILKGNFTEVDINGTQELFNCVSSGWRPDCEGMSQDGMAAIAKGFEYLQGCLIVPFFES